MYFVLLSFFYHHHQVHHHHHLKTATPKSDQCFLSNTTTDASLRFASLRELPLNLCSPLLFSVIVYWLVGLNPSPTRFACFLVLIMLTGLTGIGLGMVVASAAPSLDSAIAIGPILVIIMILFGGFYVNTASLPPWLDWVQYLSIMRWSFSGLMVNEFGSNLDVGGNGGGSGATFSCNDVDTDAGDT